MILMIGLTCSMSCITVTDIERRTQLTASCSLRETYPQRDLFIEREEALRENGSQSTPWEFSVYRNCWLQREAPMGLNPFAI